MERRQRSWCARFLARSCLEPDRLSHSMARTTPHRRQSARQRFRFLLGAVAFVSGLTSLVLLLPLTFWGLLYCAIKIPLDGLSALAVVLLLWLASGGLVALAALGASRLRPRLGISARRRLWQRP